MLSLLFLSIKGVEEEEFALSSSSLLSASSSSSLLFVPVFPVVADVLHTALLCLAAPWVSDLSFSFCRAASWFPF